MKKAAPKKKAEVTVKPKLAIVKRNGPQQIVTTTETLVGVGQALTRLASQLSNVQDNELAEVYTTIASYEGVLEAAKENIKRRALPLVLAGGAVVTEKGTRRLDSGAFVLEAQPTRTGYDPKKLESLLRMNGMEPTVAMDPKVSYVVNEGKLKDLMNDGKDLPTDDQVEACRYEPSFKLLVKKANEVKEESGDE